MLKTLQILWSEYGFTPEGFFEFNNVEPALHRVFAAEPFLKMPQKNRRERPWHLHRSWLRTFPKWVRGRYQFFRGRYNRAEPLLLETVDHPRFSFSSWLLLAKIAFLHGRVQHGRHRLLRALAANPRKFAKVREGWTALSPLWILEQGSLDEGAQIPPLESQETQENWEQEFWEQLATQSFDDQSFFSESQGNGLSFGPRSEPPAEDGENEDCFLQFGFPDAGFEEFLFGELEEEEADEDDEEVEGSTTPSSEEQDDYWGFSGSWDADWGAFLSEELFSSFAEDEFEGTEEEPLDLQDSQDLDDAEGEAQNWERFIKNPEFLDPHEARKFSLLPPIRNSEFRNLDWTYLQSRLFPKGGKTEGRS